MEQQYNTAVLNDTAGVLPMDTDVIVNGVHGKQIFYFIHQKKTDQILFR